MADETDSEKGKTTQKVLDQEQTVERAFVAPDGTITIPHGEAKLVSVDVADVDLLLGFSDGTFVVIPNGALDAISDTPTTVLFNDNKESLGNLFKMVGISNVAKAGSLRVVSGNVDAPKTVEDPDVPKPPEKILLTSDDVQFSETVAAPSPLVKVGRGAALATSSSSGQLVDISDPVRPPMTPRSTSYSDPAQLSEPPQAPIITLSPNITADNIINSAESHSSIAITGTVGGSAKAGDTVTLTVNGVNTTGLVASDKSFSINIAGSYLVADSDQTIAASITTHTGTSTVMGSYTVDISAPVVGAGQTYSYTEHQLAGAVVATVAANDNIGVTGYHFNATHTGTSADGFYTIGGNGQISITAAGIAAGVAQNNFDMAPNNFIYGIEATDDAGNVSTAQNITLNVTNMDEAPPVISAGQIYNYAENQVAGAVVAIVAATDDVGVTGYHFSATHTGISADGFYTIAANGQISITAAGVAAGVAQNDFDTAPNNFIYGIEATDAAGNVSTAQNVTLNVTNVDEAPPVVSPSQTFNYAENQAAGAVVATVAATDDIGVTGYHFSATHTGTSADGFYTIAANGQISITAAGVAAGVAQNDFETTPNSFIYGIEATDAAGNVSTAQNVTLNVTNVDEAPPVVGVGQTYTYAENQAAGAVVAIVAATDDVGVTGYRFSATHSGTSADGFYTIGSNGQISITAAGVAAGVAQNDFDTAPNNFIYGIEATDAAGNVSTAQNVTFNVTNVDEAPPVVTSGQTFNYTEHQLAGAAVAIVAATDDVGVTGYHFSATHSGTSADGFYTVGSNGQISITDAGAAAGVAQNNFDTALNSFIYGIEATDAAGNVSTAQNVTLNVTNVDENMVDVTAPVISAGQTYNYAENQAAGAVVATVAATDNVGITGYHFNATHTGTSADGFYTIASNGQISITAAGVAAGVAQNDFETAPNSFIYGIEATDAAGNVSTAQSITLNVTNVDEAPPVVSAGQTFNYAENQAAGAVVAIVAATDDVGVTGYHFSATHSGTSADGFYTIGSNGQISITAAGVVAGVAQNDFETAPNSFIYGIEATDAAGNVSTAQNVTLNVTNVDEVPPVVSAGQTFNYAENQAAGAVVAIVTANDNVGVTGYHFNATHTGTSADGFYTIAANGQISITAAGVAAGVAQNDFETAPNSFIYGIEATDAAGNVSTAQNVTLNITNVDEAPPVVTSGQTFNYAENQAAGAVVAIVAATDDVSVTGYHFSATHSGTSADGFYTIGSNGQISITAAGVAAGVAQNDFETAPNSFIYGIEATDAAGNVSTAQNVTLNVTNVDETPAAPVITGSADNVSPILGNVVNGGYTNDTTPTLSGTAEANSTVTLYDGASIVTIVNAGASGKWSYTPTPLDDGSNHSYTATATNAAGYTSGSSAPYILLIDTTATTPAITGAYDNVGLVQGNIVNGGTTNDSTPTISGIAEANSTVNLYDGATLVSTINAGRSGSWSYTPETLSDSSNHSYTVIATDVAGNVSAASAAYALHIDTTPPPIPTITRAYDNVDPVQGDVATGGTTNDTTPTISGTAEANSTVTLYDGANLVTTVTADGSGRWSYTTATLSNGSDHSYTAIATDAAGNISAASAAYALHIDTTPPPAPAITGASDNVNPVLGNVTNGGYTNDTTPTLSGTAEANSTVRLYDGATLVSTVTADGSGSWSYTTAPLAIDALHNYTVTTTDAAGNVSAVSAVYSLHIDTTPPSIPAITGTYDNVDPVQGNIANGGTTNDTTPTLSGTAEANSTVILYDGATLVSTVTADGSGSWSYTTAPLAISTNHIYTVTAADAAGNTSAASAAYALLIDIKPLPPVITSASDDVNPVQGPVANGGYTNDTTPTISGTSEANSTVRLYDGGSLVVSMNAGTSGSWSYTPTASLSNGSNHIYTATATNATGSTSDSSTSYTVHIDTTATIPAITSVYDNVDPFQGNIANGGYTNDTTPTISGTSEANSTVRLNDGAALIATLIADGSGNWSFTTAPLNNGSSHNYTVSATDVAGNVSAASAPYTLNIDTKAPNAPSNTYALDNVTPDPVPGNMIVRSGGTTNDTTPYLTGSAEAGSTVRLYDYDSTSTNLVMTQIASSNGGWNFTPAPLSNGSSHSYTLTATDAAGNVSDPSAAFVLHIDTTSVPPVITGAYDDVDPIQGNIVNGGYTNDTTPTLSGTADANSTVSLKDNNATIDTIKADGSGNWSYTPAALTIGTTHAYTTTATDLAGNVSAASAAYVLHIATIPLPPVITSASDDVNPVLGPVANGGYTNDTTPTLHGTAEINSTVNIYEGATHVGTATADAGGNWSYTPAALSDGSSHSYTATATNSTGTTSDASTAYTLHIDTTAPNAPIVELRTDSSFNINIVDTFIVSGETGARTEYSINGTDWSSTAPTMSTGHNTVLVHQIDLAGNISPSTSLEYFYGSGYIEGNASGSIIIGGAGNDTLQGKGDIGTHDTLYGSGGDDILNGGHGNNTLYGGSGHNTLNGGDGTNTFIGGAGNDDIYGGPGNNTVDYSSSSSAISASLATGTGTHGALNDTYHGIQNLVGSNYDDTLSGNSGNNILIGGAGKDTIYANQGHDSAYGGDNNDTFYVSSLAANQPTVIDGGARDAGIVQDHFGNLMVLQDLINGSYNMSPIASISTNIDTLDIKDTINTTITVSSQDVQHMVNNNNASQLFVNADNGDVLNVSLAAGQSMTQSYLDVSHTDYTISSGGTSIAQIHWHHA